MTGKQRQYTKPDKAIFFDGKFEDSYIPHILKEIWIDKVYEPFLHGKKDLTIIDVGCNVGLFTHYASKYAKQIYALEPAQRHFDVMKYMFMYNGIKNVTPIQKALSHKNGKANFFHNDNVTMFSLNPAVNQKGIKEVVYTITFDKLFEDLKIDHVDFMKVDVEGSEAEIFGSQGFDKVAGKIDVIMGEYHQWATINPNLFGTYFTDRGFDFSWANQTEASLFIAKRI